jgi:hypothetical protein
VRAHTRVQSGPGRELPLLPPRRAPLHLGLRKGERCHLGRPDGQSRGSLELSPRRSQRQGPKARGAETRAPKPPTPIGVFPFLFSSESAVRGREKGAPPVRRAEERRGHTGTPTTCQGRRPQPPALGEGAEPSRPRWGKEPSRSGNIHAAEDAYIAVNIFAMPPSTPSRPRLRRRPQREHRHGQLPLPSLLGFFQCWTGDVEARPVPLPCRCAGHRAAALPPRDGLELLDTSSPWARRRRVMSL